MRLLVSSSLPLASLALLEKAGWDVKKVNGKELVTDEELFHIAHNEERIVLFSFGEDAALSCHRVFDAVPGIISFSFIPSYPEEVAEILLKIVATPHVTFDYMYSTVEKDVVRQRLLMIPVKYSVPRHGPRM